MGGPRAYTSWLKDLDFEIKEVSRMIQELKVSLFACENRLLILEQKVVISKEIIEGGE